MPMQQTAPYPDALEALVDRLYYKPGWNFHLADADRGQGSKGLTLAITVSTPDSYDLAKTIRVCHYMIVPAAAFDERSWQRWVFEQILLVERHEACEFFRIGRDGWTGQVRPYSPSHGPGNDPYLVREIGTDEDVRTSFRGDLNPASP